MSPDGAVTRAVSIPDPGGPQIHQVNCKREPVKTYPLRPGAFDWWDSPCPRRGF